MNTYAAQKLEVKRTFTKPAMVEPPKTSWYKRAKNVAAKATVGVSAALLTLSALPTTWYAPFYS